MLLYNLVISTDNTRLSEYIFKLWKKAYPHAVRAKEFNPAPGNTNWWVLNNGYVLPFELPNVEQDDLRFEMVYSTGEVRLVLRTLKHPEGEKWIDAAFDMVDYQHDAFFLHIKEPDWEANFEQAKKIFPHIEAVEGTRDIFDSHKKCADLSLTENFYVVDADNFVYQNPDYVAPVWDAGYVHVWNSKNPNGLVYGHGGLKLFNKSHFADKPNYIDMTLSLGAMKKHEVCLSEHRYNVTPYSTWRAAFREVSKIKDNWDTESKKRVDIWTSSKDFKYGEFSVLGAKDALANTANVNKEAELLDIFLKSAASIR